MVKKILFIPIDDRPCTFAATVKMAAVADFQVVTPPENLLGVYHNSGDADAILDWLESREEKYDAAIIAADMVLFGGLVASRRIDDGGKKPEARLERLVKIIREKKSLLGRVYISKTIQRAAPTYTDEASIPLFAKIVEYSSLYGSGEMGDSEAARKAEELKQQIPADLLEGYLATRVRNHGINKKFLDMICPGEVDFMLISMDDCRSSGHNVLERDEIQDIVNSMGLNSRVLIGPGTDEAAAVLLARALIDVTGVRPFFAVIYPNPRGKNIIPAYEDRSYEEIVDLQIRACGCEVAEDPAAADILFVVHLPEVKQNEAIAQQLEHRSASVTKNVTDAICEAQKRKKPVALTDVYYANGADISLMSALQNRVNVLNLYGFAAWNTAGNSIGSALSQGIVRYVAQEIIIDSKTMIKSATAHMKVILERFADDWLYQSVIRRHLNLEATFKGASTLSLDKHKIHFHEIVNKKMKEKFQETFRIIAKNSEIEWKNGPVLKPSALNKIDVCLPWDRLFEVDVDVAFSLISLVNLHTNRNGVV